MMTNTDFRVINFSDYKKVVTTQVVEREIILLEDYNKLLIKSNLLSEDIKMNIQYTEYYREDNTEEKFEDSLHEIYFKKMELKNIDARILELSLAM